MKKLTLILLTVILALAATVILSEGAASTVYYYMPYLHSNAGNVTYCIVSNLSSETLNTTFTVGSNATGVTTGTANSLSTIAANTTKQMTFYEQSVTFGSTSVTLSDVADKTSSSYAGTLSFTATAEFGTTGTKASCLSVVMACFQGTTNPKRNLIGYACKDNGTDGPGGNNNVIGY